MQPTRFIKKPTEKELLLEVGKSLLELVNTSAGVNKLLLAGKEGMALGADINSQLAALGGFGFNNFAASASNNALLILGMNSVFHVRFTSFRFFGCSLTSFQNARCVITTDLCIITQTIANCKRFSKVFSFFSQFF
jgi:hypothetical protein